MGTIHYGDTARREITIDDRALAHVKRTIIDRLRRHESMMLCWTAEGQGDSSVWLHPAIALYFQFDDTEPHDLNRLWLEDMARAASSLRGLYVMPEPDDMSSTGFR